MTFEFPRKLCAGTSALLLLAGCAQQPTVYTTKTYTPQAEQTDAQSRAQNRARIHTELGAGYYARGQFAIALEELNEALRADNAYAPAYNVLGLVHMELREDAVAQQHFERALRITPLDPDVNNNYGWFLCQRGREEASIRYFIAALKNPLYQNPDKSYVNAGICSLKQGDDKIAEEYFRKALSFRTHPQALYHLAEILFKQGGYAEAKSYLTRHMQLAGNPTSQSLWLGARLERKLGDRNAEASYVLQLQKKYPDSPEALALSRGQYE